MAAKNIAAILGHKFNYSLPSLSFRAPYERVAVAVAHRNFTSSALSSIFNGQSPLGYMIEGGWSAMQTIRRLLDSVREGA